METKTIIISTTPEDFLRSLQNLKLKFKKIAGKNVKMRVILPKMTEQIKEELKDLNKIFQIKIVPTLNARFVVVDGKDLLFMTNDDKAVHESYDTGIWVNTPYFARALEKMFDMYWR